MSLPFKIKGKRVAKARNIELLEVPLNNYTKFRGNKAQFTHDWKLSNR